MNIGQSLMNRVPNEVIVNGDHHEPSDNNNTKDFHNINSKRIIQRTVAQLVVLDKNDSAASQIACNGNCSSDSQDDKEKETENDDETMEALSSKATFQNEDKTPGEDKKPVVQISSDQNWCTAEIPPTTTTPLSTSFHSTITIPTTTPPSSNSTVTFTSVTNSSTVSLTLNHQSQDISRKFHYCNSYLNGASYAKGGYHRPREARSRRCASRSPQRLNGLWMNGDYETYGGYSRNSDYYSSHSSSSYWPPLSGVNMGSYESPKLRPHSSFGERRNSFCGINFQSGDPLRNSFYKTGNSHNYFIKNQSPILTGFNPGGRGRYKTGRGASDTHWFNYHPNPPGPPSNFYNPNSNYQKPNPQCPAHSGGNGRYFRGFSGRGGGRNRAYSSSLSPRTSKANLRNQNYRFKTPPPSPGPNKWDRTSPSTSHIYPDDLPFGGLTVDVGGGLGNLEECSTLSSFCGFGLGGGLLCLEDDGTKEESSCYKEDLESKEGGHVVHFHINPGTTVNFTNDEGEVQRISGPATVRMVSTNSSPPIPLPVQMPPGHVVQQIVDETGTLQHVILSAQPMPLPVCSYCCQCHEDAQLDSQFMEAGDFGAEANLCSFGYHRLRPNVGPCYY